MKPKSETETKETFKAKCERLNINYWRALKRRRDGHSEEMIFQEGTLRASARKSPILVFGVEYPNVAEARRRLNSPASEGTIRRRLEAGMEPDKAFSIKPLNQAPRHGPNMPKARSLNSMTKVKPENTHLKADFEKRLCLSRTKAYKAWSYMVHCIGNPTARDYEPNVYVHPCWQKSFHSFISDVGLPDTPDQALRRIEKDLGYRPNNVTWAGRYGPIKSS